MNRAQRWLVLGLVLLLTGCGAASAAGPVACTTPGAAGLLPRGGVYVGANIDWGHQTLAQYGDRLGHRPAVAVSFTGFPFSAADRRNLDGAVDQVAGSGALLLLTLEPRDGLAAVDGAATADLTHRLAGYGRRGVRVVVRFGHEMNGSWYAWGQQPAAYVAAFRAVAAAVHAGAGSTMWAPNYGGGYPFTGGPQQARPGTPEAAALDTDGDGAVTGLDDPYAPYWPGDDAVDWVGMSLYHWGDVAPWGENEVPEAGKFVAQLRGTYDGDNGDERAVPDFYGVYGEQHGKPVAVPETAALYVPGGGGAGELAVKQAWWRQVFDPALHDRLPRLAMVNWFEWDKDESEVGTRVDWTATSTAAVRTAYRSDLPAWARWAGDVPGCGG